ncbi:MAG: hypothetical protein PHY31_10465 [Smithellaceae bacterium]|nr:hypothetical protein [Smithellaceae bacterium]
MRKGFFCICVLAALSAFAPASAQAGMAELTGLGMRTQAMGAAGVALDRDLAAAYFNPAGLTGVAFDRDLGFNLEAGISMFDLKAKLESTTRGSFAPDGLDSVTNLNLQLGFDIGRRLKRYIGNRSLVAGVSLLVPIDRLYWWRPQSPESELYTFYYDDPHRLTAVASLGGEITPWLTVGAGANILLELKTDTAGEAYIRSDDLVRLLGAYAGQGQAVAIDSALGEQQTTMITVSPIVGIQLKPSAGMIVGFTYRGELYMDDYGNNLIKIRVVPEIGLPTDLNFEYYHHFAHYFSPEQWAGGVSYRFPGDLLVSCDLTYMHWSKFLDVFHESPDPGFKDTYVPRIGIEKKILSGAGLGLGYRGDVTIRAGYGFWKSPVPEQTGVSNFLDNDRHIFTVGGEVGLHDPKGWWDKAFSVQFMFQYHWLVDREYRKAATGEVVKLGGAAYNGGISIDVRF